MARAFDPRAPWRGGLKLVAHRSYPLWDAISGLAVFFMSLWLLLVGWPVWNPLLNRVLLGGDRESIRRWRRRKAPAPKTRTSGMLSFDIKYKSYD